MRKTQKPAKKVKAYVFLDVHILFIDYLVKGKTINDYHIVLLVQSKDEIAKKKL